MHDNAACGNEHSMQEGHGMSEREKERERDVCVGSGCLSVELSGSALYDLKWTCSVHWLCRPAQSED